MYSLDLDKCFYNKKLSKKQIYKLALRGCQCIICFLSLTHAQHRQNALRRIVFSMILSKLRVKLRITKKIDNNIFERMTYRFYILLLFDFIFGF